ncbi:hypothetical protein PC116_g10866 [Phytophthora cactorum]|nr:hypothetical protein PC114_g9622 [Phytophthora cactorum]KAG3180357.1 hypothetical protein C6341_g6944 [Phytophthora cactorum]KAG4241200.1 hypothetical protein PC116_g10866 [Phytophthora cactorum]
MFGFIENAVNQRLQTAQVAADVEQALIDSIGEQFPTARVIGCLFHWKQAIRRRMMALYFSHTEISIVMEVGIIDMLTVIPPADIDPAGLRYVESQVRRRCREEGVQYSTERWTCFWAYFRRTWLVLFAVDMWNVHEMDLDIVSRTNNPLERFNRELNAAIPSAHPSLAAFVGTIDGLSQRYVRLLNDIINRRTVAPQQGAVVLPVPVQLTRQRTQRRQQGGAQLRQQGQARRGRRQRCATQRGTSTTSARSTQRGRRAMRSAAAA